MAPADFLHTWDKSSSKETWVSSPLRSAAACGIFFTASWNLQSRLPAPCQTFQQLRSHWHPRGPPSSTRKMTQELNGQEVLGVFLFKLSISHRRTSRLSVHSTKPYIHIKCWVLYECIYVPVYVCMYVYCICVCVHTVLCVCLCVCMSMYGVLLQTLHKSSYRKSVLLHNVCSHPVQTCSSEVSVIWGSSDKSIFTLRFPVGGWTERVCFMFPSLSDRWFLCQPFWLYRSVTCIFVHFSFPVWYSVTGSL